MERTQLARDSFGKDAQFGFIGGDAVTLDGSSAAAETAVYTEETNIRLSSVAFADCWIVFGVAPTAVAEAAGAILVNGTEYTKVAVGEKISVIGGKLNIVSALA